MLEALASAPKLNQAEFTEVCSTLYRLAGIVLRPGKEELVQSRLGKRLRSLRLASFREYLALVATDKAELATMVDVLTTNKTSFMREPAHFDLLVHTMANEWSSQGQIRLWSAACSSGEEPYTIAMSILDHVPELAGRTRILATDLASHVLARAKAAEYPESTLGGLPSHWRARYFERLSTDRYRIRQEVRRMVRFGRLNLLDPWPMRGPFDAIFCRNVMIYFDKKTQLMLAEKFRHLLSDDGLFLVGHSESLGSEGHSLRYIQPAVYKR